MAFNYNEAAVDALELIAEFGQAITLTKQGNESGGFDPVTGDVIAAQPSVTVSGAGVLVNYKTDELGISSFKSEEAENNILAGDAKILCSLTGTPEINMTLPFNGKTWRVVNISTLQPSGTVVMYTLQVRA